VGEPTSRDKVPRVAKAEEGVAVLTRAPEAKKRVYEGAFSRKKEKKARGGEVEARVFVFTGATKQTTQKIRGG